MDEGLTRPDIYTVVNRYIGVGGGYLGDFSYRSHAEFYLEYCDLDINPYHYQGTTRERFIAILGEQTPERQAVILRGVLKKYPVGSSDLRTQERHDEILRMIQQLEGRSPVPAATPQETSSVVSRALSDAETLIRTSGATSGVDRIHTALHGHLRVICEKAGISVLPDAGITDLFKAIRRDHPAFAKKGHQAEEMDKILRAFSSILDTMNPVRNRGSVAHPNPVLLEEPEAMLCINAARTLLHYLDHKVSS